ncbi:hypothetical protein CS022_20325 [Veronia nyctiphanis]|uniref:Nidogen G2 beta-barrel domain-containing protein n=1 Tax=Veronia nyctiphanis TaxID=1278244 RepID=A0A4Q0YLL3_9GAMM|nr:GMC family oxidoreductase [Veronia nyctiphanis]RXJ71687.1 hypothetical protein CS022_20325 [Veronia nyctiphanis]
MMTSFNDHAVNLDGMGYGCKIETAPLHTGLLAATLPWRGGESHKKLMLEMPYYAAFAVINRDRHGGSVSVDREGKPSVSYRKHRKDHQHSLHGVATAAALHSSAGAEKIIVNHHSGITFQPSEHTRRVQGTSQIDAYLQRIRALNWAPNAVPSFSAHQMGSCRMGGNEKSSPVRPDGRLWGVSNLYVADTSLFPSASGINPMITAQSLARHIALNIVPESVGR